MGCAFSTVAPPSRQPSLHPQAQAHTNDLPPILLMSVDTLLSMSELPRLGISPSQRESLGFKPNERIVDPVIKQTLIQDWRNLYLRNGGAHIPAPDLLVELKQISPDDTIVGFVSHCWLRGWPGAPGYKDQPHPDDADNHKFKLLCEALEKLQKFQYSGFKKQYVWIDFCCINQDGNPAAELKQLDLIIKTSDFILTPIHDDQDGSWQLSSSYDNLLESYEAVAWQKYLTRGWCLIEMLYAANIPLKDNAAAEARLAMVNGPGMKSALLSNRRPHFLFGTRESRLLADSHCLPPLQNSFFTRYNPVAHGETSDADDKEKIRQLVLQLQPYIEEHSAQAGFIPDVTSSGMCLMHYTSFI